jgi:hypothetical protein
MFPERRLVSKAERALRRTASVGLVDTGLLDPPYFFTRQLLDIYLAELLDLVR